MKSERKIIIILLLVIILFSLILIYKLNNTPKYDQKIYDQVYREYEEIISETDNKQFEENDNNLNQNNITYIKQNISGDEYKAIASINIEKINISYPIVNECTDEYLKVAPAKLFGPDPNQVGNFVVIGHNYNSNKFFSKLSKLENGDIVEITDRSKKKIKYKVYDKYEIDESDFSCMSQNTNGKIELTLITCINFKRDKRLVVKCIAEE